MERSFEAERTLNASNFPWKHSPHQSLVWSALVIVFLVWNGDTGFLVSSIVRCCRGKFWDFLANFPLPVRWASEKRTKNAQNRKCPSDDTKLHHEEKSPQCFACCLAQQKNIHRVALTEASASLRSKWLFHLQFYFIHRSGENNIRVGYINTVQRSKISESLAHYIVVRPSPREKRAKEKGEIFSSSGNLPTPKCLLSKSPTPKQGEKGFFQFWHFFRLFCVFFYFGEKGRKKNGESEEGHDTSEYFWIFAKRCKEGKFCFGSSLSLKLRTKPKRKAAKKCFKKWKNCLNCDNWKLFVSQKGKFGREKFCGADKSRIKAK